MLPALKNLVGDHPHNRFALAKRNKIINARIDELPAETASDTFTKTKEITVMGVLRGVLAESWRYDFVSEDGHTISGKLDDNLSDDQVVELNREFFNQPCIATFEKSTVLFRNGRERTTHVLKQLEATS